MFNFFKKKEKKVEQKQQEVKQCNKCGKQLALAKFARHNRAKDGRKAKCFSCGIRRKYKMARPKGNLLAKNETIKITIKDIPMKEYISLVDIAKEKKLLMNQIYRDALSQFIILNSK
jgi:hypothetical protein